MKGRTDNHSEGYWLQKTCFHLTLALAKATLNAAVRSTWVMTHSWCHSAPTRKPQVSSTTSDKFDWRGGMWWTELRFLAQRPPMGSPPHTHTPQYWDNKPNNAPSCLTAHKNGIILVKTHTDLSPLSCTELLEHKVWSKTRGVVG